MNKSYADTAAGVRYLEQAQGYTRGHKYTCVSLPSRPCVRASMCVLTHDHAFTEPTRSVMQLLRRPKQPAKPPQRALMPKLKLVGLRVQAMPRVPLVVTV